MSINFLGQNSSARYGLAGLLYILLIVPIPACSAFSLNIFGFLIGNVCQFARDSMAMQNVSDCSARR